jgi:glycosyltransferase involved in cell wall biosynthesis
LNIVFIHTHFPGPFEFLARVSGRDKTNQTVFISAVAGHNGKTIPGVNNLFFSVPPPETFKEMHPPATRFGPAVANILADLRKQRFIPDLIIGHSGSGTTFHVKDVFQDTPFLGFFDWFHQPDPVQTNLNTAIGSDFAFRMDLRHRNLSILSDLCACDQGICPTAWQKNRFPEIFHSKLSVNHPGVDTRVFKPMENPTFPPGLPGLTDAGHLISCTTPLSKISPEFGRFMASLPGVLRHKPGAHVVVAGSDRVFFDQGSEHKPLKIDKSMMCEKFGLNPGQIHFPETMPHDHYIKLLQASSVHVCLDPPRLMSYALLQAMSCGCLVMAPAAPLTKEIITDGNNGILADFSTPDNMSRKLLACLDYPSFMAPLKHKARQTVAEKYAAEKTVPGYLAIIRNLVRKPGHTPFG